MVLFYNVRLISNLALLGTQKHLCLQTLYSQGVYICSFACKHISTIYQCLIISIVLALNEIYLTLRIVFHYESICICFVIIVETTKNYDNKRITV